MKLLHAADLHIDSPLRGLSTYEGAPADDLRTASRRALENLVSLAESEPVDAVLLAGDIYDGDWRDYQTGLFFVRCMSELREAGIPVYMVSGNHDAQNRMTRSLRLPSTVFMLEADGPETRRDEGLGLAVHGQSFKQRDVSDNLAITYPEPCAGLFNVGLLHTALGGREGHELYAPCSVEHLAAKGYDYWALGHVHKREVVSQDPWIVFPGNAQGRHARETGPKGCTIVEVDDLRVSSVQHHDLDVARWEHLKVDVSEAADPDAVVDLVAAQLRAMESGRLHAVRVSLVGRSEAHLRLWREQYQLVNDVRMLANELSGVWVEKVRIETRLPDSPDEGAAGLLADLARTAAELRADEDVFRQLVTRTPLLSGSLSAEVWGEGRIDPADSDWLGRIGDEAVALLESLVSEAGESR
ncbi:DNA repair exonuclease SbcCD nuclease subunit [Sinosporangium album]|uniref:DNA repair exonuclease SbcCD nuclease subunit n=1 Tax=Sinosporangium album TaxID=504805 RepID=A0A1G7T371_9ACTN|nr:DNA repair exonuclease [Sinosporangium album]SDG29484.1 DNA repair exonuclease SbcCD nuclease subunit [Sinosporangium album]